MKSNCKFIKNQNNKLFISRKVDRKKLDQNSSLNISEKSFRIKKNSKTIFIIKKMKRNKKKLINSINDINEFKNNDIPDSFSSLNNKLTSPSLNSFDSLKSIDNELNKKNKPVFFNNALMDANTNSSIYDTTCITNTSSQNIDNLFAFKEKHKDMIMIKIVL